MMIKMTKKIRTRKRRKLSMVMRIRVLREKTRKKKIRYNASLTTMFCWLFRIFDTTRCGYIYDKDLGDLVYSLGLALSRSQVKKLIQKVSLRDSVHYKKLAEKIKPEEEEEEKMDTNDDQFWEEIVAGNRKLLTIESKPEPATPSKKKGAAAAAGNLQSGFVMHKGNLVDLNKLLGQLNKSENIKMETERALTKLKTDYAKLKESSGRSERTIKELQNDIRSYKDRLASTFTDLSAALVNERSYFRVITDIHNKVAPVLKKKEEEEEAKKVLQRKAAEAEVMEIVELTDEEPKKDEPTKKEPNTDEEPLKEEKKEVSTPKKESEDVKAEP
uniref:Cell division cycle and apoptosis regulator protein 1 n=1 Tax=Lygus hesperus TaxID=30085 RepID=A0A0A9XJ01_LYGHE